jgi:hypothetical protein
MQVVQKLFWYPKNASQLEIANPIRKARRVFKKTAQQGRSERGGKTYPGPYVEPLSDAKTPVAEFYQHPVSDMNQKTL